MFIKKLKNSEYEKMKALKDLNISNLLLPYTILGNYIIMPRGNSYSFQNRPNAYEISQALSSLYKNKIFFFSEGIYSFARQGKTHRKNDLFFKYIDKEIELLISNTILDMDLEETFNCCYTMWKKGFDIYKDTTYDSYEILHGDLHLGNILNYKNKIRLIDWEYLRSGPKELELGFYVCWEYLQNQFCFDNFSTMLNELDIFIETGLINSKERCRIISTIIPMWLLITLCYLNNGNLLYKEERILACKKATHLYYYSIWNKMDL